MSEPVLRIAPRGRSASAAPRRSSRPGRVGSFDNGWQGSAFSTDRSFLSGTLADARKELPNYTRLEMVRKARYFKKNVGLVRGMARDIADLSVGQGIFYFPGTDSDEWNEGVFNWLWEWAKIGDVSARCTLWESQWMRVWHKFWDGELYTLHTNSAAGWPQWQTIRAHNCGNFSLDDTTGWSDGIKLNGQLRPQAFNFRTGDDVFKQVPASAVVHSYMLEDSDQVHGVTALHYCIKNIHDIVDLLKLEMGSTKDNARVSRVIKTESGEDEGTDGPNHFDSNDDDPSTDETEGLPLEQVFGAEIVRLRTGESLESYASTRPSATFQGFIDFLGRDATTGSGFPYEYTWNRAGLNSAAMRAVMDKVRIAIGGWRNNEIEDSTPIVMRAIATAMQLGEIPFHPQWFKGEWIGGAGDPSIDKGRDANQDRENVKAALDNFKLYWARQGKWWKTQLRQKAIEAAYIDQLAKDYGVSPDRIHQLAVNNAGQAPAATTNSDPAKE